MTANINEISGQERFRGSLKWFNHEKGYGFIVPDSPTGHAADIFLHVSELQKAKINPNDLYEGIRLSFGQQIAKRGPKKPCACDIKVLEDTGRRAHN